jgi:Flp pilus assembly protein TadG
VNGKNTESGQALVLIVVAMIGLLGMTALTVDGGLAYSDRSQAQYAADAASLAAALANAKGQNATNTAMDLAASNSYNNDGVRNIVAVTITATASGVCPQTGKIIKVDITSNVPTTFAKLLGVSQLTNKVTASSKACDVSGTPSAPLYAGNSVYTTRTTACGNGVSDKAIYTGGSSQLQMWGGGLGSSSTDGDCVDFKGGNVQLKKAESGSGCADINMAAASGTGQDFSSISGQDGCGIPHYNQPVTAPPADLNITCPIPATWVGLGGAMTPGNYTGTFPPSGVTSLSPGTYCVNGDFTLNGGNNLSGNGVTIVMNTGGIKWNGNMTLHLSGPANGQYKGLTIYMPPTNDSQIKMNGSSNVTLVGTLLAQNAPCDFVGSGQIQKVELQMICYTWQMSGSADVQIMYNASTLYSPSTTVLPSVELLQ